MKISRITIDPDPYEPFRLSQGYRVGELLFLSGQAAIDGDGRLVGVGNFDAQAEQVFTNLERVLRAGGSSLANVIKVTIFLRDMSNFQRIVELRGRYFTPPYPADTIVEVTSLYSPEALIEIEAIAVVDEARTGRRSGDLRRSRAGGPVSRGARPRLTVTRRRTARKRSPTTCHRRPGS
jgi:reactive intermediate/imine deaminase